MAKEKQDIIKETTERYVKLPEDKKMFVLGIMQGILIMQGNPETEKNSA